MIKARDNPFAAERVFERIRYHPVDLSWREILSRLESLNYRAAIVGPHGTGKTTLTEDLMPHLESLGFRCRLIWLNEGSRAIDWRELTELTPADIVLLDGAEQLSPTKWWLFRRRTRRAGGLVITTHLPGRLP